MAVDTAVKRYSMIAFRCGIGRRITPIPDSAFDADDRLHLMGLYQGISADSVAAGVLKIYMRDDAWHTITTS